MDARTVRVDEMQIGATVDTNKTRTMYDGAGEDTRTAAMDHTQVDPERTREIETLSVSEAVHKLANLASDAFAQGRRVVHLQKVHMQKVVQR